MSRIGSIAVALLTLAVLPASAGPAAADALTPALRERLAGARPDERIPVVVLMAEFPDTIRMLENIRGLNRAARRARVVAAMKDLAERSQRPVRQVLALETDSGRVRDVRILWGVNGLAADVTPDVIEQLAALPEVDRLIYDRATPHPDIGTDGGGDGGVDGLPGPDPEATVRPDVVAHGAKQVWDELGYTGAGVLVAVIDTNFDRTHPDIADHVWSNPGEIAGNALDDDGNGHVDDTWGWDFCNNSQPVVGTHGTQVAGQVAGDGTNGSVTGMAPDARLMSLGIDCDTPSRAWQASDYALAKGADVITQSYSWWWTDQPDYSAFRRQAEVELAAGVIHVNSAGNSGASQGTYPIPYNISTPGNCPPPWIHPDQVLAGGLSSVVAAGDVNWGTDTIASSSSLGPSAWEEIRANTAPTYPYENPPGHRDYPYANGAQMGLIKPDLAAYGTGTVSTCPGGGYCSFSGTSSAAPHISGAIALMLQSNPEATPAEIAEALMTTAQPRGAPGKDNVYGAGLLKAYPAVQAIESGVVYQAHTIDDTAHGNGDLSLDPGETVVMPVTVESRLDAPIADLEAILSTQTPGVTIHDRRTTFPLLPARGTAASLSPQFSFTVDPAACATEIVFDLELRYGGHVRRSTFGARVGVQQALTGLDWNFETAAGWTSDPGTASRGAWTREDPVGVPVTGGFSNPENDTTPAPGTLCWVTGSGGGGANSNDVDGGSTYLLSPIFGAPSLSELSLTYDRWYYDDSASSDSLKVEVSNNGGTSWTLIEQRVSPTNGWANLSADLMTLIAPSTTMRLRFTATDGGTDNVVEAAVDEVHVSGQWVQCQGYTAPLLKRPNPVGNTLQLAAEGTHARLSWTAPSVDAAHDAATLYRIERASSPQGPWSVAGTATTTSWFDIDALQSVGTWYYRVTAENSGGHE